MSTLPCQPLPSGSITGRFRTTADADLVVAQSDHGILKVAIIEDHPVITSRTPEREQVLDVEDATTVTDGTWHSFALTVGEEGTKFYLDGYLAFCGTATIFLGSLEATSVDIAEGVTEVTDVAIHESVLTDEEALAYAPVATPLVQFAGNHLSDFDTRRVGTLISGTAYTRFRVRGIGQGGTMLSAGAGDVERLKVSIDATELTYAVLTQEGEWRSWSCSGDWADGEWHDVVVRAGEGAIDLYVDGFREARIPGQAFFGDITGIDSIMIGQDIHGSRLFGEVSKAAIYPTPLTEGQIKRLSHVSPLPTHALFDRGLEGSISYRIPSLLALPSGVVIAGADQRTTIANDSPNDINFVIRRSEDGGLTWDDVQTVLKYPGEGADGASVIDSCTVYDSETGVVHCLIDHFPGGIGQPNNEHGVGMDDKGHLLLFDAEGKDYVLLDDGSVVTRDGEATDYTVSDDGTVTHHGKPGGNIYLKDGVDPDQTLLTARTSYLVHITSEDEGKTWSQPKFLNSSLKEDWMAFLGTSPGTGLQLRRGKHKGRLVIPVYYSGDITKHFSAAVIFSDDHGATWKRGASPNDGRVYNGDTLDSRTLDNDEASTHESTLLELPDGRLLVLMRNQHPSGRVGQAFSDDGGETWGDVSYHDDLTEIFSQPNAIEVPGVDGEPVYVFANASQLMPYRGNGVLRLSKDRGATWPVSRTFNPGHYVYQSMTWLPSNEIGLLWENEWQGLYFTRIPLSWFD
ncbi:MAG: sialidase family protein [Actinomycetaceae bacterium]|nr:sialidase family protein [Actinomycetaceae bacterium]